MTARVALLTTNLARGGAETQVARLAIELRSRGWDVSIVSLLPPSCFVDELAAVRVPVVAPGLRRLPFILARLRPQILHCHMFHANVAGRLCRLAVPVPVVISTIHSMKESARGLRHARARDWVYRLTDGLVDVNVFVSQAAAGRHLEARAMPPRKAQIIGNGVDLQRFRPDAGRRSSARAALGWNDRFVWLAVGRLMWKKDFPALLTAFARLPPCVLAIAGTGPDEAALRNNAPPGVEFLGARDDVADLMAAADGFVLSSVVEGLPVVVLEAFASGLMCVGTDVGGVGETGPVMLVPPRDPDALAEAMRRVMEVPAAERLRRGEAARAQVASRFSWPAIAGQWETLYRELLPWT